MKKSHSPGTCDGAWADYLLTAVGLTIVVCLLLVVTAGLFTPVTITGNQAALTSQAREFQSCIAAVTGSRTCTSIDFIFTGNIASAEITGEELILKGGGATCNLPLVSRVYAYPIDVNGSLVSNSSEMREALNDTFGFNGKEDSPLTPDVWAKFSAVLEMSAMGLALTPLSLDASHPVFLDRFELARVSGREVIVDVLIFVYQ